MIFVFQHGIINIDISRLFPTRKGAKQCRRKDGRYAHKYTDTFGKVQFVYAWKLVPTDKTPAGNRDEISLREKEKEIQKDLDDGIDTIGKKMTVCGLTETGLDFENRLINVDHQLLRSAETGYYIEKPKAQSGI